MEIPEFIGSIVSLRYLNLSFSSFYGEVPASLGNLSKLESLDLYAQTFIDEGPTSYNLRASNLGWLSGLSSSLTYLNMGFVSLSGADETWLQDISRLPKLKELHLFNCELRNLPLSLSSSANLKLLEVLDLSRNSLRSPIPNWLFDLTGLRKLTLQWVELQGSIPSEIKKLRLLETLDLSFNALSGEIPDVLGNLPQLKYLDLSHSSLEGQIHRLLDALSKNKGDGLVYLGLNSNSLNGTLPAESLGELRNLQILDFSLNYFTGSIPSSVGNMASLKKLALHFNSMEGKIPESLGKLDRLETLDLSSNKFSGAIPQSLAAISSLHTLNLSYNKLEGRIPKNPKFKDPSIYIGNELLCGKPLPKKCSRKQQTVVVN
ncbi:disease resistance family protein / LRR family protein [Raphanus sativus]|nr:disease resistance family protein / LRR family protein [Raphanus sativus]